MTVTTKMITKTTTMMMTAIHDTQIYIWFEPLLEYLNFASICIFIRILLLSLLYNKWHATIPHTEYKYSSAGAKSKDNSIITHPLID